MNVLFVYRTLSGKIEWVVVPKRLLQFYKDRHRRLGIPCVAVIRDKAQRDFVGARQAIGRGRVEL